MHQHTLITVLFQTANLVIVAGYLSVPFLVLPYLPLTGRLKLYAGGFFAGCAGTHAWMAFLTHDGWFWMAWHLTQAACTWAFILGFRNMLRTAQGRRAGGGGRQ